MSKLSQLHAELSEQAYDMGYVSLEEALSDGWEVDYENAKLIKKMSYSDTVEWLRKEEEKAHEAWLEEKRQVLNDLDIVAHSDSVPFEHKEIVKQAIEFIRKGEM